MSSDKFLANSSDFGGGGGSSVDEEGVKGQLEEEAAVSLAQFKIGAMLGKGAYGQVFEALHKQTGARCAVKIIDPMDKKGRPQSPAPQKEADILSRLDHPSVVWLMASFMDEYHFYLVTTLEKGTLHQYLEEENSPLGEPAVKKVLSDIAAGLSYLHQLAIVHRDIKPPNIFVGFDGSFKLAGFRLAHKYVAGMEVRERIGTVPYMAPEVDNWQPHSFSIDCWSLGVTLLEVVHFPLANEACSCPADEMQGFIPVDSSPHLRDVLVHLLQVEPSSRMLAADVAIHPFLAAQ